MTTEAQETSQGAEGVQEDPFQGIQSEAFDRGERVEDEPTAPVPVREAMGAAEESGGEDAEAEAEEGADDNDGDEGADDDENRSKSKRTAQERINELTRLRREAEREAAATKAELEELRSKYEPPEPETVAPKEGEAEEGDGAPKPDDYTYGELDPAYIRAITKYETEREFTRLTKERETQDAVEREYRDIQDKFQNKIIPSGTEKHEDFHEVVVMGAEEGKWALSEVMGKMLVDSEVGDDIAYHLASNPDEALDVSRQSPVDQARYFGKMEAKFSAARTAAPVKSEAKPPKAPPPVTPARGADGKFLPSADSDDFAAFERRARQEM